MGKKGNKRKTRWRVLPIGGEDGDCLCSTNEDDGDLERVSGSPASHSSGAGPGAGSYARATHQQRTAGKAPRPRPGGSSYQAGYYRHRTYHDSKQPLVTTEKKTFNEEEYTKITTPRQDVLFKKGYLGRKKPPLATSNAPSTEQNGTMPVDGHAMHNGAGHLDGEHMVNERIEMLSPAEEQAQIVYTNGYMDQNVYYINSSGYELYDPYMGNVTVVVGPAPHYAGPSGGPPVLAAVSCQPLPLQPLEWFNPAFLPYVTTTSCPRDRRKRSSTDSQNCSPQSSESTDPPGSPQECEEVVSLHNGDECAVYQHQPPAYVYPGYMFGPPVYNMNGITVQGVPPQPQSADVSGSKRRKKKRRRRRRRGGVDDGSEESSSDEKELEEPVSLTSHESSQELESDSKQSAESAIFPINGSKDLPVTAAELHKEGFETGEANADNTGYCSVNGTVIGSAISVKSEVNKNVIEIPITNSAFANVTNGTELDSLVCGGINKNSRDLQEIKEKHEINNESLCNFSTTKDQVLKSYPTKVSNIVTNIETSSPDCSNTLKADKSPVTYQPVSNKDVIFLSSDNKHLKGDTQTLHAKEKLKGKKSAKLSKQKQQNVNSECGELQLTDVQTPTFVSKMDGNEAEGCIKTYNKSNDAADSKEKPATKSQVSVTHVAQEKICISTTQSIDACALQSDASLSSKRDYQTKSNTLSHTETPKKPVRKDRQQQQIQHKKVSQSNSKENSQKMDILNNSQTSSSLQLSHHKMQVSAPDLSVAKSPVLIYAAETNELAEVIHQTSALDASGVALSSKTIKKCVKGGDHILAALSETSLPMSEAKCDSITNKDSSEDVSNKSSLDGLNSSQSGDKVSECQYKLGTSIAGDSHTHSPETSINCSEVTVHSSLIADSPVSCITQDRNKSHKTINERCEDRKSPCVARRGHSPELQRQVQNQNKEVVHGSTPPPIPPPRRKKWQSSNRRSSMERPPTPGRDLENSRCSEVLTDESCSSSTSHESEESVIELLSPTSSPDSKSVGRIKELSSEDEEGVIFGTKNGLKTAPPSLTDNVNQISPYIDRYQFGTVYEVNTLSKTKTAPDKEKSSSKTCKLLPENLENDLSLNTELKQKYVSGQSQMDSVWGELYHKGEYRFQDDSECTVQYFKYPMSLETAERFADAVSCKVLAEALSDDLVIKSARDIQPSTLPITEAVTRWLHSQSTENVLCLPQMEDLESDLNDEQEDDEGTEVEANETGGKMTGQKNVLRNPLPASSHKFTKNISDDTSIRVASSEINNYFVNSNNDAYQDYGLNGCEESNNCSINTKDIQTNVDCSLITDHGNLQLDLMETLEQKDIVKSNYVASSMIHTTNNNIFDNEDSDLDGSMFVQQEKHIKINDTYKNFLHNSNVLDSSPRNGAEESSSSFTSESVEYDAEWDCDLLAPSEVVGIIHSINNDDSNLSVGSPDDRCSYMCDPTLSVAKYYRLGTPAEKIATIVQEQSSSETETDEEIDALEHFRNELDIKDNSQHMPLADELLLVQEPLPNSWAIDPIELMGTNVENDTFQGSTDLYESKYRDYRASDSGIQSEDSGNEAIIKINTNAPKPLSETASVLHRKSAIFLSQFSGDGPVPCGGICCILQ